MRFGIMSLQIDLLLPPDVTAAAAMAELRAFDHAALVRRLATPELRVIEIGADLALFLPGAFTPEAIAGLAALKSELGIAYTVHLPLWSVEPSTPQAPVRGGSVAALTQAIEALRPLDPEVYVLHATGALAAEFYSMRIPEAVRGLLLAQFQAGATASVRELLQATGIPSRQLAVETIEFPFELTLALAEELDLGICFDAGHVLVGFSGPIDVFDALERCLPRLAEVHLHDGPWQGPGRSIGYGRDHQALGRGDLDVARLLARLAEADFRGPVVFELTVAEALASLDHIRAVYPAALPPAS